MYTIAIYPRNRRAILNPEHCKIHYTAIGWYYGSAFASAHIITNAL